jgi:hypothetical protein
MDLNASPEDIARVRALLRKQGQERRLREEKSRRLRLEAFIQRRAELNRLSAKGNNSLGMFDSQKTIFRSQSTLAWYRHDGTFVSEGHEMNHNSDLGTIWNYSILRFCHLPKESLKSLSKSNAYDKEQELGNKQQSLDLLALRLFADPRSVTFYTSKFTPRGNLFGIEDNWIVRNLHKQTLGVFDNCVQAITFSYHYLMCNVEGVKVLETYCPPHDCDLHEAPQQTWLDNHFCLYKENEVSKLSELLQRKCEKVKVTSHDELFHHMDLALIVLRFEHLENPDQRVYDSDFGEARNALLGNDETRVSLILAVSKLRIGDETNLVDAYINGEISFQELESQVARLSKESFEAQLNLMLSNDSKSGDPW